MNESSYLPNAWGRGFDAGYQLGRSDALGEGAAGLLAENKKLRAALVAIGARGKRRRMSAELMRSLARAVLGQTGAQARARDTRPLREWGAA